MIGSTLVFALQRQNHDEFKREAERFSNYVGVAKEDRFYWDPPRGPIDRRRMFQQMLDEIASDQREWVNTIAIFCHGFPRKLQIGLTMDNADDFAEACTMRCVEEPRVIMYTCSAASNGVSKIREDGPGTDGGLCDEVRDRMLEHGLWPRVYGHKTSGHTTRNPYVVEFTPEDEGIGGHWLCEPGSEEWDAWKKFLKGEGRFLFPFMHYPPKGPTQCE